MPAASTSGGGRETRSPGLAPARVSVRAERQGAELVLRTEWPTRTAAAAFRRGRHIWVVFGSAARLDLDALRSGLGKDIYALTQLAHDQGTVLRMAAARRLSARLESQQNAWLVHIGPRARRPQRTVPVEARPYDAGASRVLVRFAAGSPVMRIPDPDVGDTLFVVPLESAGVGVEPERRFAEFRLLATAQGIAVEPHTDDLRVNSRANGVEITTADGLHLSSAAGRQGRSVRKGETAPLLFDFQGWSAPLADADGSYSASKQWLQAEIVAASDADRNFKRLDLARFYFAHGMAADALGTLQRIADDDPEFFATPSAAALRGASRLLVHRLPEAAEDLSNPGLDSEPEISLWRGALAAMQRSWRAAVANFREGHALLARYPKRLKVRFALLAAEAELLAGDTARARSYLDFLAADDLGPADRYEKKYLLGRILEQTGEPEAAVKLWTTVAAKAPARPRVEAQVARIDLLRSRGELQDPRSAIAELDRLRFVWRGDALEYAVLQLLGNLYMDVGDHRHGLEMLARALRLYPTLGREQQLAKDIQDRFAAIFLGDASGKMTPLQALGLYREFRQFTPADGRGDRIIGQLVDRLVSVDLLGRAAELLAEQISRRARGVAKARLGARLALLHLLNRKPTESLNALQATDVPGMPAALAAERRLLGARAYAALEQNIKALALLIGDTSRDAELLRADIYWRVQDWSSAAKVLARLVGGTSRPAAGKLSDEQSRLVLRWVVALALSGDSRTLREARRRFDSLMAKSPYAEAYRVVATDIESGEALDYPRIVEKVKEVGQFQAFMSSYRKRLESTGLAAVN